MKVRCKLLFWCQIKQNRWVVCWYDSTNPTTGSECKTAIQKKWPVYWQDCRLIIKVQEFMLTRQQSNERKVCPTEIKTHGTYVDNSAIQQQQKTLTACWWHQSIYKRQRACNEFVSVPTTHGIKNWSSNYSGHPWCGWTLKNT